MRKSARALQYFEHSIRLCKELGSDVELARSYRAFADFVSGSPTLKENSDLLEQAANMASAADDIFARLKAEPHGPVQRVPVTSAADTAH